MRPSPPTEAPALDHSALWAHMRRLLERTARIAERETLVEDCLDVLIELLGANRALVLLVRGDGTPHVMVGRARGRSLAGPEREEISKSLVREALEARKPIVWDLMSSPSSGTTSVLSLGIVAGLAAPLSVGDGEPLRGVLYADFRDHRRYLGPQHVEFFLAAASLFTTVLEQFRVGQDAREELREAKSHCVEARAVPSVADLLGPRSMSSVRAEISAAIDTTAPILILGESGTGKTLLAMALAEASRRRPIVRAMLGGSDDLNTLTSELFGHERGAFSGATSKRAGLVEYARGGTLIMDELLNLAPHAQRLLLDFTQFGTYRPLGYDRPEPKRADVRIIGATNGDLSAAIADGRFREDLYYRLAAHVLRMPSLRERREDIPALAESILLRQDPSRAFRLSLELRKLLASDRLDWPGNMRQLERTMQRAWARAVSRGVRSGELQPEHLDVAEADPGAARAPATAQASEGRNARDSADDAALPLGTRWQRLDERRAHADADERRLIEEALARHRGVVSHAAKDLGVARTTLMSKIETLGIPRSAPTGRPPSDAE